MIKFNTYIFSIILFINSILYTHTIFSDSISRESAIGLSTNIICNLFVHSKQNYEDQAKITAFINEFNASNFQYGDDYSKAHYFNISLRVIDQVVQFIQINILAIAEYEINSFYATSKSNYIISQRTKTKLPSVVAYDILTQLSYIIGPLKLKIEDYCARKTYNYTDQTYIGDVCRGALENYIDSKLRRKVCDKINIILQRTCAIEAQTWDGSIIPCPGDGQDLLLLDCGHFMHEVCWKGCNLKCPNRCPYIDLSKLKTSGSFSYTPTNYSTFDALKDPLWTATCFTGKSLLFLGKVTILWPTFYILKGLQKGSIFILKETYNALSSC